MAEPQQPEGPRRGTPGWAYWTGTFTAQQKWARDLYGSYDDCRGRAAGLVPRLPKSQAAGVLAWWIEAYGDVSEDYGFFDALDDVATGGASSRLDDALALRLLVPARTAVREASGEALSCVEARSFWEALERAAAYWDRERIEKPESEKVWEVVAPAIKKLPATLGGAAGAVARGTGDAFGQFMAAFMGALGPFWIVVGAAVLMSRGK